MEGWKRRGLVAGSGIPAPSGRFTVGCVDICQSDLLVRLMYPTSTSNIGQYEYARWFPHPNYIKASMKYLHIKPACLVSSFLKVVLDPRSPALLEAPLQPFEANNDSPSTSINKYPVVIFSHGLGAHRCFYSGICCDIVSHGYIVAAVEHRDQSPAISFNRVPGPGVQEHQYDLYTEEWIDYLEVRRGDFHCRNQQVLQRSQEVRKALDLLKLLDNGETVHNRMGGTFDLNQFQHQIDTETAAVMGHSFGGGTVVQVLSEDARFRCGIALDAWMLPVHQDILNAGIKQSLLFINSFEFQWWKNILKIMKLVENQRNPIGHSNCSIITIRGTNHFTQCDLNFVVPQIANHTSSLDKTTAHSLNLSLCHAFLKRHLLKDSLYQKDVPNLDGTAECDRNLIFGTNVDLEGKSQKEKVLAKCRRQQQDNIIENLVIN